MQPVHSNIDWGKFECVLETGGDPHEGARPDGAEQAAPDRLAACTKLRCSPSCHGRGEASFR
jgi:hypothetical protein